MSAVKAGHLRGLFCRKEETRESRAEDDAQREQKMVTLRPHNEKRRHIRRRTIRPPSAEEQATWSPVI
jgi:hypothetical protein